MMMMYPLMRCLSTTWHASSHCFLLPYGVLNPMGWSGCTSFHAFQSHIRVCTLPCISPYIQGCTLTWLSNPLQWSGNDLSQWQSTSSHLLNSHPDCILPICSIAVQFCISYTHVDIGLWCLCVHRFEACTKPGCTHQVAVLTLLCWFILEKNQWQSNIGGGFNGGGKLPWWFGMCSVFTVLNYTSWRSCHLLHCASLVYSLHIWLPLLVGTFLM